MPNPFTRFKISLRRQKLLVLEFLQQALEGAPNNLVSGPSEGARVLTIRPLFQPHRRSKIDNSASSKSCSYYTRIAWKRDVQWNSLCEIPLAGNWGSEAAPGQSSAGKPNNWGEKEARAFPMILAPPTGVDSWAEGLQPSWAYSDLAFLGL